MKYFITCCTLLSLLMVIFASDAGEVEFCSWSRKNLECKRNEFLCSNREKCLNSNLYCNGQNDCGDNSDERYCNTSPCPGNYRGCGFWSNKCIPSKWYCNGHNDCSNGHDESNCQNAAMSITEITPPSEKSLTAINNIKQWVKDQRNKLSSAGKWGSNVDRLALVHFFSDHKFDVSRSLETEMTYELNIQFLSRLLSMKLEDIPSTELASYVNAFLVMCINPRNFHGYDIIQELKNRVDQENYTNPYVLLALCNAGDNITESDKNKLIDDFEKNHRAFWTGMQAAVLMALACANKQSGNELDTEVLQEMMLKLKQQQYANGTVINFSTTALVMQALLSMDSERDRDTFDEMKALNDLLRNQKPDGSFGGVMGTLLVTPVLTCKSLANINSDHCQYSNEISELEKLRRKSNPSVRVRYSLWIGDNRNVERNLNLRVPRNTSLYGLMEMAAEIDSRFQFEYAVKNQKPYINAISGIEDNPLAGKFWFLYFVKHENHTLSNLSPAKITPGNHDHYVMWYRSGSWQD